MHSSVCTYPYELVSRMLKLYAYIHSSVCTYPYELASLGSEMSSRPVGRSVGQMGAYFGFQMIP